MMNRFRPHAGIFCLLILVLLQGAAVGQQTVAPVKPANGKTGEAAKFIVFPNLTLSICESRKSEFRVKVEGSKATVEANVYEDFGGVILCFDQTKLRSLNAYVRYDFRVKQYVYDNQPAPSTGFVKTTEWSEIQIDGQQILIPQSEDNFPDVKSVFEQLGFENRVEFERVFEFENFETLKQSSYDFQKKFYTDSLKTDRQKFEECCPEYISQAEEFLSKRPADFKNLEDLGLEVYRASTEIELVGETVSGKTFKYYIIDTN